MSKVVTKTRDARQRIIETAENLFYAEGVRAVGIDRIIAEACVAKMTLYNHFASKDDLILAVLEYREQQFDAMFEKSMAKHAKKGKNSVEAFFGALKDWFASPGFRGCSFLNAAIELADKTHPASRFSAAHKCRFNELIKRVLVETAGDRASRLLPAVSLLVEGAVVTAQLHQSVQPASDAQDAALLLISKEKCEWHLKSAAPGGQGLAP